MEVPNIALTEQRRKRRVAVLVHISDKMNAPAGAPHRCVEPTGALSSFAYQYPVRS